MKEKRRGGLDRLQGLPKYIELPHKLFRKPFVARCADGDMAARFGRPDVCVVDLERMAGDVS